MSLMVIAHQHRRFDQVFFNKLYHLNNSIKIGMRYGRVIYRTCPTNLRFSTSYCQQLSCSHHVNSSFANITGYIFPLDYRLTSLQPIVHTRRLQVWVFDSIQIDIIFLGFENQQNEGLDAMNRGRSNIYYASMLQQFASLWMPELSSTNMYWKTKYKQINTVQISHCS